jgi:hypothetical protein
MKLLLGNAPVSGFERGMSDWIKRHNASDRWKARGLMAQNPFGDGGETADEIALAAGWEAGMFVAQVLHNRGIEF